MIASSKSNIALHFFVVCLVIDSLLATSDLQCLDSPLKTELSYDLPEANSNFEESSSIVDQSCGSSTYLAAQSARAATFKSELQKTYALVKNATFIQSVTALDIRAQAFEFLQIVNFFANDLANSERYCDYLYDLFTLGTALAEDALQTSFEAVDIYHSVGKSNETILLSKFKDVLYPMIQLTYDLTSLIVYIGNSLTKNPAAVSEYTLECAGKSIIKDSKKLSSESFCFVDLAVSYL